MINLQHFIFTPKYRRPFFAGRAERQACEALLRRMASLYGITLRAVAVMPDHVHVFAELPRTMSVARAAMLLKWYSSLYMRKRFPDLKKQKALWGHRYYFRSVGGETRHVEKYIQDQRLPALTIVQPFS